MPVGQLLRITPAREISFSGTNFGEETHATKLVLENVSEENVAFKVKTTALKAYLVRPSQSVLQAGEKVEVQIMLQRLTEIPANHRHRFLVQAVATRETNLNSREAWPQLIQDNPVQEFKLSVVFPDVNGATQEQISQYASSGGSRDLQSKYEELAEYTKALTERKQELQTEIEKLRTAGGGANKGFQFLHIVFAIGLAFAMMFVYEKFLAGNATPPPPVEITVK